jgi:hypothetical protein
LPELFFSASFFIWTGGMSVGGAMAVRFRTVSAEISNGCRVISIGGWELFGHCAIMVGKLLKFFHEMGNDEKKFRKNPDRG